MPCTTILVGKKASNDGSTIIARNDEDSVITLEYSWWSYRFQARAKNVG